MKKHTTIRQRIYVAIHLFIAVLFSAVLLFSVKVSAEETITVSIDRHQLMIGEPLTVSVNGLSDDANISYIWTVGEEETDNRTQEYTPSADDYEKWIEVKVTGSEGIVLASDRIWFSKLPVVYINTDDGAEITSKTEYKSASMLIQGSQKYGDAKKYNYDGTIQIKGRGNSTWSNPKKPYKIKLDTSTDIFGFGKNKHWVLLANYWEESLVRNTVANEIATEMGLVGTDTTWVDVVMNGSYIGNYQFCEHIRIAESRVNIFNWSDEAEEIAKGIYKANKDILTKDDRDKIEDLLTEDFSWVTSGKVTYNKVEYNINDFYDYEKNISGGYLLELTAPTVNKEVSEFKTKAGMRVIVDKPENTVTNKAMMDYIKTYMQDYEDAILALDGYNSENLHYTQKADFASMVNYWLVLEICGNGDAQSKSRWAYKDTDELLSFGPVWDFDWALGSATVGSDDGTGWKFTKSNFVDNFFKEWVDDPYFIMKAQERYWNVRPYLQSIIDDGGLLDEYHEYLKESGAANESIWKFRRGYEGDTKRVKTYLKQRLIWLDEQFASEESITESLYTEYSANPYIKSDDKLIITLDHITGSISADGLFLNEDDLVCNIVAADENTKEVAVYVNGLKLDENKYIYNLENKQCSFVIPAGRFTEEFGTKNVISLIGRDRDGAVTYTNFFSVVVEKKYTIQFDSNGGSTVKAIRGQAGMSVQEPEEPYRENYTFGGWYGDRDFTYKYEFETMPEEDITLYAKWDIVQCKIIYKDYDGTVMKEEMVDYGSAGTPPEVPQREGYTFDKWSGSVSDVTEDITVTAEYKITSGEDVADHGHNYDSKITISPTTRTEGLRTYTCSICGNTYTEAIPKLSDSPEDKTGASDNNTESITIQWNKIKNAAYYEVYVASNGEKYGKAVSTIKASAKKKLQIKSLDGKAVDPDKEYKFKIKAYCVVKGKKKYLATSGTMYVVSKNNKKYTNVKKIVTRRNSYKITKGKKVTIKTTIIKQDRKKKLLPKSYGAKLSYVSSNKKVATVTKRGKIMKKGKGTCYIYIRALNGLVKKIKVTVK